MKVQVLRFLLYPILLCSCVDGGNSDADADSDSADPTEGDTADVPRIFTENYTPAVTISTDGTSVILKSAGIPDHPTPYWGTDSELYVEPTEGKGVNPGIIREQDFTMTIPINPEPAAVKEETSLGPIGMAVNGVAIYNDREGGNVPVDAMIIENFDNSGGHVGPGSLYHYHFEPNYIANDDDALIGHLRDGFPIYGRREPDGSYPTDLDENGGHFGPTKDYPEGIYHYHCSAVNYLNTGVYILKAGAYHGTKGTFTS